MPFLLMAFLTVACLPAWAEPPGFVQSVFWSALLTWLGVACIGLESFWSAWRVRGALVRNPAQRERVAIRSERRRFVRQFVLLGVYAVSLYASSWGWAASQLCSREAPPRNGGAVQADQPTTGDGEPVAPTEEWQAPVPGVKVLVLAPFFVSLLLTWIFAYDADRALFLAAYRRLESDALSPGLLDGGQAAPFASASAAAKEFGGRWSYVAFQGRQKLALVFLPVLLLVAQQEIILQIPPKVLDNWALELGVVGVLGVLAVLLTLPWMVRLALGLKPLPPGPTRDRLMAASRRLRFRCSDVLLWNTRGGMANAMVIGVLPWPRYVIFTDRFLEEFNGDEVEAVFGHEVGHVKHHHMLFYLGFLMLSMAVGVCACLAFFSTHPSAGGVLTALLDGVPLDDALIPVGAAALLVYIFIVFGFLSRRCERQADVYGCKAVSCGRSDCAGHEEGADLAPGASRLCPTGVRTFIYALEKVADVNGISRNRPGVLQSWQHGSIGRRVAFLYGLIKDPTAEPRFQRRLGLAKWGLFTVLCATLVLVVAFWPPLSSGPPKPDAQPAGAGVSDPPADGAPAPSS
jgi:STE24 endopeptidase